MEKKRVSVQIEGRNYAVITIEEKSYVLGVADEVTESIRHAAQTGRNLDTRDCAVLAALDFCDDRHKAERRNTELVEKADQIIRQSAELAKQCKEYKTKLAAAINENTNLTKRIRALEEQLRLLLRENESLKKNTDSRQLENEKKFEKAVRDKKAEKLMGYVPMRQYSLFEDAAPADKTDSADAAGMNSTNQTNKPITPIRPITLITLITLTTATLLPIITPTPITKTRAGRMEKIEILAPAGGFDSIVAAVRSGADAVYLGEKRFSARASAKNFSDEELRQAVAYCHVHGVKVYVTLNTLVFDEEFEELAHAIRSAAQADADALIVQNMGVARLARQIAPALPLHASTQMSVHTASGVRALYELGFRRVVLAREMTREEIKKAAQVPVELEVFVHGALCMSVSGQCYFSAMLGSRSGNRGACAQTCRLPFSVNNQRGGYALSLKDNSLIPYLNELEAIGVASAKIEGRMKRPEYVAAAVRACVEQRDLGFVTDPTAARLRGVFSRTGFTDGYYTDRRGKGMFGTRTRGDVAAADEKLLAQIRQTYKDEAQHIPLSGSFAVRAGEKGVLRLTDGTHTVEAFTDCAAEPARSLPLSPEKCRAQLAKTGGTAYRIENLSVSVEDGVSLPLSALNTVRRAALAALDARRAQVHHYEINEIPIHKPQPYRPDGQVLRARVPKTKLGEGFRGCERVFVPLFSDTREWERLLREGYSIGVEVPRGMFGREEQIERQLSRAREAGVSHALCHNIGALWTAKRQGFVLHGGFGLNLCNTYDLLWAEEYGIADVELSWELTFERINRLGGSIGRGIVSYGYLPLMLCRSCPVQGAGMDCKSCKNRSKMTDRKGKRFLLRCDGTCTEVLNCVPLHIAEKEISKLSTSFHILRFTVENSVENVERVGIINDFSMLKDNFTRGLYKRGVE